MDSNNAHPKAHWCWGRRKERALLLCIQAPIFYGTGSRIRLKLLLTVAAWSQKWTWLLSYLSIYDRYFPDSIKTLCMWFLQLTDPCVCVHCFKLRMTIKGMILLLSRWWEVQAGGILAGRGQAEQAGLSHTAQEKYWESLYKRACNILSGGVNQGKK